MFDNYPSLPLFTFNLTELTMNKLYTLACLLLAALFVACGPGKDRIRFEGTLSNINDAEFYVYSEDGAFEGIDTVKITDGKFVYERKMSSPAVLTLLYPNFTQTYIVVEPGSTIKMKGDASKIGEAQITGTEQNELLSDFRIKHTSDAASNQRLAAAQFIRENAQTLAAVAVFRKYFANKETPDAQTALQLLDVLKKAQPKEKAVAFLEKFYRPIFLNGAGEPLPVFTAQTIDGATVSSNSYKGKKLVIACVGTWQSDSRPLLINLRRRLRTLGGEWQCLVVSLDVDHAVLRSSLKNDSINYPVICDRQAFNSPLVQTLGLHYVPSLMLVNEHGKIIQRDVTKVEDAKF